MGPFECLHKVSRGRRRDLSIELIFRRSFLSRNCSEFLLTLHSLFFTCGKVIYVVEENDDDYFINFCEFRKMSHGYLGNYLDK